MGACQVSMRSHGASCTNAVVWNDVGIDQTTTCALAAGQTCPDGLSSGDFVELGILPLQYGTTVSDSFTACGAVPFQFQALLSTNMPTPIGRPDIALFIAAGTVSAVPEPASGALMRAGFGLLGGTVRRQRPTVSLFSQ